ncbi:MAG: TATA-box-binding protein [Candidatus Diapherotrites archaeon]|nr:TATA-box-binding protein [Candidatus Diapherotrites archaeon]
MKYTVVNMVASASLDQMLDLYSLAVGIPNIEYEPEQFPGAILKIKEPKVSMLLFKNGKIICSGASNEKQIEQGIRRANKLIHDVQKDIKVKRNVPFEIVNFVATASLEMNLDLFEVAMKLPNVEYEPEQFPGAILRLDEPKLTFLLFKNGKMICAGAKKETHLKKGLKIVEEMVGKKKVGTKFPKKKTKKKTTKKKTKKK